MKYPFFVIALMALTLVAGTARAEPKPWIWSWGPGHWKDLDFKPYLEDGKHQHNSQWDKVNWAPQDWIAQRKSAMDLMRGFYRADVLRDQYVRRDDMPVLVVGPQFYRLGGHDKRRVMQTVDMLYEITASKPNGMFQIEDWRTEKPIGTYTIHGLQIQ